MVLQLHVLGPAFGLPSIDAECTAVIALLTLRFGNDSTKWTTVQAHTAIETLPLLVDGTQSISGFSNICHHLRASSESRPSADGIALISLIQSRAPALISAYLYLAYENYSTTVRPAFTPILPLLARFIVPGALRAAAKERTAQLGISSLDIEQLDERSATGGQKSASESAFEATTVSQSGLTLPRAKTVRSLLAAKPESLAAFKLRSLADAFLEPLQLMLDQSEYLSGKSEPGAVDCLAFAYLDLMLSPPVPQPWLRTIIKDHYPKLEHYVRRTRIALALDTSQVAQMSTVTISDTATEVIVALRQHIPFLQGNSVMLGSATQASFLSQHLAGVLLVTGAAIVAGASWALWPTLSDRRGDPVQVFGQRSPAAFSHVSAALSGLDFLGSTAAGAGYSTSEPHISNDDDLPARMGIEIET